MQTYQKHTFLPEIKRFISYYSICLFYQKTSVDEQTDMNEKLNNFYQDLLVSAKQEETQPHLLSLIQCLIQNINNHDLLSSLQKATLKTLIKLLSQQQVTSILNQSPEFDTQQLVLSLMEVRFEIIDASEEEQMLTLIQKTLLKVMINLELPEEYQFNIFHYFMKVLKVKSIEDADQIYSVQFADQTKKNLHKVLYHLMYAELSVKSRVFKHLFSKIKKSMSILEKKPTNASKLREFICFVVKTIEDCFRKIPSSNALSSLMTEHRADLVQVVCQTAEFDDPMIQNQAQQLFTLVMQSVLEMQLPLREELELMLVKVALKPVVALAKKLDSKKQESASASAKEGEAGPKKCVDESDNDEFIQVSHHDRIQQEDLLLEMKINYLLETILLLSGDHLASLFLMYDCQPFSESVVTKSLQLIFRLSRRPFIQVFQRLAAKLCAFSQTLTVDKTSAGQQQVVPYMLEQKTSVRKLARDANAKFKLFMQRVEDQFGYVDADTPYEVAAKILVYSRDIQIDKIAEIIGGKEDKYKKVLQAYLAKMDYKELDLENSLRKFLQTFRLAGVDSQVVLRILEQFSHRFFELDSSGVFEDKTEVYEFVYLIIVLQTCQHNPSVKNKTDLKAFVESAHTVCPKSKARMPQNFFEHVFDSVTRNAFFTPASRSIIGEAFNSYNLNEIDIRLSSAAASDPSQNEFVNAADLTQKQLFHMSNSTKVPNTLVPQAIKHILSIVSQRFIRFNLSQPINDSSTPVMTRFQILKDLALANKSFFNNDTIDKLFQVIYKVGNQHIRVDQSIHLEFENLLWDNFDCIKRSLVLLPKLSVHSFMKDQVKTSLTEAFKSVRRLALLKQQEVRRLKTEGSTTGKQGQQQPQQQPIKQQSFFDLVYNYFTDNTEDQNSDEKNDQVELDHIDQLKRTILLEDKEEDYAETIEEKFDEKSEKQWDRQQGRLHELITLICNCLRENLNQEEGIYCLGFLEHITSKQEYSCEILEKIWVEIHLLLNQSLRGKDNQQLSYASSFKEEKKIGDQEVISTDTSQDSIDANSVKGQQDLEFFTRETDPLKTKVNQGVIRQMLLKLHLNLSQQMLRVKRDNIDVIKDIQRVVNIIIESDLSGKSPDEYGLFDDMFLFHKLSTFIENQVSLKSYPKLSKLLRLMLILILKSLSRKLDFVDEDTNLLLLKKLEFFNGVTKHISESSSQLPYDQITLALEIYQKFPLEKFIITDDNDWSRVEKIMESASQIIDNLGKALSRQRLINDETKQDLWFKLIQALQEKVIFNQVLPKFEEITVHSFNVLKNLAMNHPFELDEKNYVTIQKLFSDIILWQTFESLNKQNSDSQNLLPQGSGQKQKEEVKSCDDDEDMFEDLMQQLCTICINSISDIFIYYISILFKESQILHQPSPLQDDEQQSPQRFFTFLWLNLLKVLLHYAEKSGEKDFSTVIQSVHENIKRVMEFLIQQGVLREQSENAEMAKLWKTSWEYISAFFTSMRAQVLGIEGQTSTQAEKKY